MRSCERALSQSDGGLYRKTLGSPESDSRGRWLGGLAAQGGSRRAAVCKLRAEALEEAALPALVTVSASVSVGQAGSLGHFAKAAPAT